MLSENGREMTTSRYPIHPKPHLASRLHLDLDLDFDRRQEQKQKQKQEKTPINPKAEKTWQLQLEPCDTRLSTICVVNHSFIRGDRG